MPLTAHSILMNHVKQKSTYRILILTIWRDGAVSADECKPYLYRLEDPHTGERYGFTDAASLFIAIQNIVLSGSI
jgi:hypothetical protein